MGHYERCRPLLESAARRASRGGGDYEESLCEANLAYARCRRDWAPAAGPFLHYLRFMLRRLRDAPRRAAVRSRLLKRVPLRDLPERPRFDLRGLLAGLGRDGRDAVAVAILLDAAGDRRPTRREVRRSLKCLGWNRLRVERAFRQVEEALS